MAYIETDDVASIERRANATTDDGGRPARRKVMRFIASSAPKQAVPASFDVMGGPDAGNRVGLMGGPDAGGLPGLMSAATASSLEPRP